VIVKTQDIVSLMKVYNDTGNVKNTKYALNVLQNRKILNKIMEDLETKFKPSEEYKKFLDEYIKLCNIYASKDDSGKPLIKEKRIQIDAVNKSSFLKELEKLKFGYSSAIKTEENKKVSFEKELDTERFIELHCLNIDDFPLDLTAEQLQVLSIVIRTEDKRYV